MKTEKNREENEEKQGGKGTKFKRTSRERIENTKKKGKKKTEKRKIRT
jgi:hypothetical protein